MTAASSIWSRARWGAFTRWGSCQRSWSACWLTCKNHRTRCERATWAEPLQENVSSVFAENLARLLATESIFLNPWPGSATLDYQARVDVQHFDGWLGGESTLLAVLGSHGVQAVMTIEEATDAEVFRVYVEQVLRPTLRPGDIVIMDNLRAHKAAGIREAIEQTGARL